MLQRKKEMQLPTVHSLKEREREKCFWADALRNAGEAAYPVPPRSMLQQGKGPLAVLPNVFYHVMVSQTGQSPKNSSRRGQPTPASTPGYIQSSGMTLPSKESNFSCSSEPNNELLFPPLMTQRIDLKIYYFPE